VNYVLEHSEASLLFVGKLDTWNQQEPAYLPACPASLSRWRRAPTTTPGIRSRSRTAPGRTPRARRRTTLAMIIYTSGSTGQPKGVMQLRRITRASQGITADIKSRIGNLPENRIMSYLPLAHVFERSVGRVRLR
jgi:long-subunit acyl-CoA synthetase (AMP-forming)